MGAYTSFRGDTFTLNVQVTKIPPGAPSDSTPVPIDITGWTFWFTVKKYFADPDNVAVFQGKTGDGSGSVTITQPLIGMLTCVMPAIATTNYPDGPVTILYDVQGKDTLGNISTVDSGSITVNPDLTRAIA